MSKYMDSNRYSGVAQLHPGVLVDALYFSLCEENRGIRSSRTGTYVKQIIVVVTLHYAHATVLWKLKADRI